MEADNIQAYSTSTLNRNNTASSPLTSSTNGSSDSSSGGSGRDDAEDVDVPTGRPAAAEGGVEAAAEERPAGDGVICWRYSRSPTASVLKRGHSGTCGRLAGVEVEANDEEVDDEEADVVAGADIVVVDSRVSRGWRVVRGRRAVVRGRCRRRNIQRSQLSTYSIIERALCGRVRRRRGDGEVSDVRSSAGSCSQTKYGRS